jgi:hypothetical protein
LSPVREYIRQAHPPSHTLSSPLRIYFQDLLELWSKRRLPSGNLVPELVSHLGNINQLILEGLLTEDKSTWVGIGQSIITLDGFSGIMLKGDSPLLQKLPHLIEVTGDETLRWRYASWILRNARYRYLIRDPDILIKEGIQYFNAGAHPVRQGDFISPAN